MQIFDGVVNTRKFVAKNTIFTRLNNIQMYTRMRKTLVTCYCYYFAMVVHAHNGQQQQCTMHTPFLYITDCEKYRRKEWKIGIFTKNFSPDSIAQRIHWMHGQRKHTDTQNHPHTMKRDKRKTHHDICSFHIHLCAINTSKADRRN